jgi:hypothetical protein
MNTWYEYGDMTMQFTLGALGAGVRVAIGHDKGEPQSKAKIIATFISGTVLAGTSNQAMTAYLSLPQNFSGAASFLIGLLGIGFVYQALDGKLSLPFLRGKDNGKNSN